ncbi:MAG: aspartate aminotransferase family protein [Methylacidiphilales bacterium]|nr:aspartate aminotransferase family protein [Candidatus Methylacidiphilales bacterium]
MLPELITSIPGPRSRELAVELRAHESRNVTYVSPGFPVFWERAREANVWDVDGNRFLDLTSGFGVASLGYAPEKIVAAVQDQAARLYHAMGDVHPSAEKAALCRRLSQITFEKWKVGAGKVILTNSGSEAVEAALKTAWLATNRRGVLAFAGSYHGLGYGALTVTGRKFFRDPFAAQLADFATFLPFPSCRHCPFGATSREPSACPPDCMNTFLIRAEKLLSTRKIGAILVEPVLGRGGEVAPPDWFLPMLRSLADQYGAPLIFDEIYTGFYRTGPRFACDHWKVRPDLLCLGKALTSGFPLAACVGRAKIMDDAWPESTGEALHTSTFLGNPLGCRMALESLDLLEAEPWGKRVVKLGDHLEQGLRRLQGSAKHWGPISGLGLMLGIEVVDASGRPDPTRAGQLVEAMLARGIILLSGGVAQNVLSFTSPFVIREEEIDFAINQLADIKFRQEGHEEHEKTDV